MADARVKDVFDAFEQLRGDELRRTADWACRICGCSNDDACEGGCYWLAFQRCSSCTWDMVQPVDFEPEDQSGWPAAAVLRIAPGDYSATVWQTAEGTFKFEVHGLARLVDSGGRRRLGLLESGFGVDLASAVKRVEQALALQFSLVRT